ncbi:hypothetical protein Mgra_00009390 [Meloidogyne graminicola]|uniref:GLOBIN domain-containing protein n=1 Tax=Meloidogyne graminicola TaxID=189291 RepID=A0A8S9ZBS3_9BILA|nr:hypothetical protein Mgra_00009390 [Meloidogyne graminicola]
MNSYIIHSTLNVNFEFNNNNKQQKHQHLIVSPETNEKNKSLNIFNNNIQTNGNSTKLDSSLQSQQFLSAPRPLRRCRSSSPSTNPTLYRTINGNLQILNFEQQILIRKSWSRIQKSTFGNIIFEKMIEKCPSIERLFNPLDPLAITRHERYFTELIQWAVDGMAEPDKLLSSWLEIVGREHNQFKIKRLHWDYMGEALTESICQSTTIIGKQRRETIHAWRLLLSFLADRLGGSSSSSPINLIQEGGNGFNRIHLLQLVADGPRQYQTEEKDLKII